MQGHYDPTTKNIRENMNNKQQEKKQKISPCPYCHKTEVHVRNPFTCLYKVECDSCSLKGPTETSTEEAISAWNHLAEMVDYGYRYIEITTP